MFTWCYKKTPIVEDNNRYTPCSQANHLVLIQQTIWHYWYNISSDKESTNESANLPVRPTEEHATHPGTSLVPTEKRQRERHLSWYKRRYSASTGVQSLGTLPRGGEPVFKSSCLLKILLNKRYTKNDCVHFSTVTEIHWNMYICHRQQWHKVQSIEYR